jgi:effector-binding domain-containing protein
MPEFKIIDVAETPYLYVERTCSMDPADISKEMGSAFQQVWGFMQAAAIKPAGSALSVYYSYDPDAMTFRSGFTVDREDMAKAGDEVKSDVTPAGNALHFVHKGSYSTLRDDYGLMMQHLKDNSLQAGVPGWEFYMNDPSKTPEDELLTECYLALA